MHIKSAPTIRFSPISKLLFTAAGTECGEQCHGRSEHLYQAGDFKQNHTFPIGFLSEGI